MRKTYCDRCGGECRGKIGRLMLIVQHTTNRHEAVGSDGFEPLDLCGPCTEEIRTSYGFKLESYGQDSPEMAERAIVADLGHMPHP